MPPTFGNGKICYLDIPSRDPRASAAFYERTFGWRTRTRGDGSIAFDDGVGEVSGTWTARAAAADPGVYIYIMVSDMAETVRRVIANGGAIVQPPDHSAHDVAALFRDPDGNVFGIYERVG